MEVIATITSFVIAAVVIVSWLKVINKRTGTEAMEPDKYKPFMPNDQANMQRVLAEAAYKAGLNPHILSAVMHTTKVEPGTNPEELSRMIDMRLRAKPGQSKFQFMMPYKCKNTVVVFLVMDDQPMYLEDEWGLFPSDALITKLRLML